MGRDITPWTLNLGTDPVTHASMKYNNLVFVDDDFMITTDAKPNRYILTLKVRQIS